MMSGIEIDELVINPTDTKTSISTSGKYFWNPGWDTSNNISDTSTDQSTAFDVITRSTSQSHHSYIRDRNRSFCSTPRKCQ